jgi:hypothetical protein
MAGGREAGYARGSSLIERASEMSDVDGTVKPFEQYGEFSFPVPRLPHIRIWGLKSLYPDPLWVSGYTGSLQVGAGAPSTFPFKIDEKRDTGAWTTAVTTDFVFLRKGPSDQGWIHLSLGPKESPKYTIYVYEKDGRVGTVFGKYTGQKTSPEPFPDGGENYFWEMSDSEGLWLWLYRLYGPVS